MVELASYYAQMNFFVCDSLAAPTILGIDFCDKCLQAIQPSDKVVALEDRKTLPILRDRYQAQQRLQQRTLDYRTTM